MVSRALYALDSVSHVRVLDFQFQDVLPLLTWQVVFVNGVVLGFHRRRVIGTLGRHWGKLLIGVLSGIYALGLGTLWLDSTFGLYLPFLPAGAYENLYDAGYVRVFLQPGRLIDLAFFVLAVGNIPGLDRTSVWQGVLIHTAVHAAGAMTAPTAAALVPVLVVDDDQEVAGIHTGFLLAHGAFDVVDVAHTGARALELVDQLRPRLVLLDIHLPDMTGIDVLRALRNRPGEPLDVIAITAARELDTVRAAVAGGVLHYLVKPFSAAVLNQRLDSYTAYRRDLDRQVTDGASALDQGRIDELVRTTTASGADHAGTERGPGTTVTPKGLSAPTLDAVVADLRGSSRGASASDVANHLGMARVSARRYLEFLVSRGQARIVPQYGSAGRPEKFYVWTEDPRA